MHAAIHKKTPNNPTLKNEGKFQFELDLPCDIAQINAFRCCYAGREVCVLSVLVKHFYSAHLFYPHRSRHSPSSAFVVIFCIIKMNTMIL